MTKQQKHIIIKFSLWFLCGVFLIIIGISNVFADTYDAQQYSAQLYDNYGPNLSAVSTNFTNMSWRGTIPTMVANSSGAAWGISSPIVLLANHTYSMSIRIEGTYGGLLVLSTYNRIGVGTSLSNAVSSYQNNSYVNENYSKVVDNEPIIQFAFTPTINANYIVFPFATNYSGNNQSFYLYNVIIDDLGASGVSESTINNSLNNQTNVINNSITNTENALRGAISDTENNINNNIDNNTNKIDDTLNNQLGNKCENLLNKNNYVIDSDNYLGFNVSLEVGKTYTLSSNLPIAYYKFSNCLYCGSEVSGPEGSPNSTSFTFTISDSSRTFFIEPSFGNWITNISQLSDYNFMLVEGSTSKSYCEYGTYSSKLDDTNNAINNVDNTLKDDSVDENGIGDAFDSFNDYLDDNSTITQLITLPITLYTAILNNLNGTCQPFNLGQLYGEDLILPCINISQYLGSALWSMIDIIISGFAVYAISKKMIKVFNNFSSLREGDVIDD